MSKLRLFALLFLCTTLLHAQSNVPLAMRAIEGDDEAVAELRRLGQPGVDALFAVRAAVPEKRFRAAVDQVCRQRDCAWSRLYWYTDFEEAKRAALATQRPILSLRLLGNLDEELSCANSRYFRTLLYSNAAVSQYMRENYVLHWESVRPVPVVTIEMGDGRRMVRTFTGNSIHYLADTDGRPFDALPGLYSPQAFVDALQNGRQSNAFMLARREMDRQEKSPATRASVAARQTVDVRAAARALGVERASRGAMTKAVGELPTLNRIALDVRRTKITATIPNGRGGDDMFDLNSIDLIRSKRAGAPGSLDEVLASLRDAVAADTLQNEEDLRPRIQQRIAFEWQRGGAMPSVEVLNDWVYREVFLTPPDDAWMGLTSNAAFTAIDGEGLFEPKVAAKLPAR